MDSIITVDPDPQADLKHVRAPPLLPALLAPPRLFSYLFLPTCLPACPPCLPACPADLPLQIAEAKEFMKRRFVTKLASRNIAYKV